MEILRITEMKATYVICRIDGYFLAKPSCGNSYATNHYTNKIEDAEVFTKKKAQKYCNETNKIIAIQEALALSQEATGTPIASQKVSNQKSKDNQRRQSKERLSHENQHS